MGAQTGYMSCYFRGPITRSLVRNKSFPITWTRIPYLGLSLVVRFCSHYAAYHLNGHPSRPNPAQSSSYIPATSRWSGKSNAPSAGFSASSRRSLGMCRSAPINPSSLAVWPYPDGVLANALYLVSARGRSVNGLTGTNYTRPQVS